MACSLVVSTSRRCRILYSSLVDGNVRFRLVVPVRHQHVREIEERLARAAIAGPQALITSDQVELWTPRAQQRHTKSARCLGPMRIADDQVRAVTFGGDLQVFQ